MAIKYEYGQKTVREFVSLFEQDLLNLNPAFQRRTVWSLGDRKKFIESVLGGYAVPSVFLYANQNERGQETYDVIDGKQRLESLLMFQGIGAFRGKRYSVRATLDSADDSRVRDWRALQKSGHEGRLMGYKVQTVEVRGEFSDIRELFVRINSTGKRLTGAERRHAKFFHSELLQLAERLARQFEPYLRENGVLSPGQVGRMKHVELVCELLASLASGGPINKKTELDRIIAGKPLDGRSAGRVRDDFCCTMRIVRRVFPNIRSTRFAHAVDFYSIFLFLWDLQKKGCILTDKSRNGQAERLLTWLSQGVESVREHLRKVEGPAPEQSLFRDYLLTIKGDTDSEATRRRRGEILDQILGGVFEKKDSQRNFTLAQRRLIWNSDDEKCCRACGAPLTWDNFTIDHVKPHALGGKTELSNAALMCGPCNSKKGKGRLVGRTRAAASAAVRKAWETRRRSRGRTASTAR